MPAVFITTAIQQEMSVLQAKKESDRLKVRVLTGVIIKKKAAYCFIALELWK